MPLRPIEHERLYRSGLASDFKAVSRVELVIIPQREPLVT